MIIRNVTNPIMNPSAIKPPTTPPTIIAVMGSESVAG
jgi:hypothetical protein